MTDELIARLASKYGLTPEELKAWLESDSDERSLEEVLSSGTLGDTDGVDGCALIRDSKGLLRPISYQAVAALSGADYAKWRENFDREASTLEITHSTSFLFFF